MKKKPSAADGKPPESPIEAEKRGRGRPFGTGFKPTPEQRDMVTMLVGFLVPEPDIARSVLHPKTKRPIAEKTLRKHFRDELDNGVARIRARSHAALFKNVEGGNVTAQIWFDKTRNGIREDVTIAVPVAMEEREDGESISHAARVVAFTLAMGVAHAEREPKKKVKT